MVKFKNKEYLCPVCHKVRERGSYIRIGGDSRLMGYEVKVCMRGLCQKMAKKGLTSIDGLLDRVLIKR